MCLIVVVINGLIVGFIMGLIMKKTSGKVNPGVTNMVLEEELNKL